MALLKCTECGHEVSDRASACPNCGCPISRDEKKVCVECGTQIPDNFTECPNCGCPIEEVGAVQERVSEKKPRKKKGWIWFLAVMLLCLIGGGTYFVFNKTNILGNEGYTLNSDVMKNVKGKFAIMLYNDNMGEFYHPSGGRICSFTLLDGRKEPMVLKLSKSLFILGKTTDRLYLSYQRLFTNYSDYLSYNSSYNPNKELGVAVESREVNDGICYTVSLDEKQIEVHGISSHKMASMPNVDYTLLYYNDEYGTLFDTKGKRICGAVKGVTLVGDLCVKFSKPISMYGVTTKEIVILGDNLYTSSNDLIDDRYKRNDEASKSKAYVKRTEENDATIYSFTKLSSNNTADDTQSSDSQLQNSKSNWDISSIEELQRKIEGTVWTCRPTGKMWYRLVFSSSMMTLYYAEPQHGRWLGGAEDDKWRYKVIKSYTSDTGEKCFSIQFKKPDGDMSFGALFFLKGGDVEFSWLREYGGRAECKDFNWE